MKKRYLCSLIVSIMIIVTFSAGCITDGTNPIVISAEKQELFNKAIDIINNPTETLRTGEQTLTSIKFEAPNKFILCEDDTPSYYWSRDFIIDEPDISYIKNGLHISTKRGDFFFVKDTTVTDMMFYSVFERHEINPNHATQKHIAYILLLNEEDYRTVTDELKAHM